MENQVGQAGTAQESPLSAVLGRGTTVVNDLTTTIETLRGRLAPILQDVNSQPTEVDKKELPIYTKVVEILGTEIDRINNCTRDIAEIIERLEI